MVRDPRRREERPEPGTVLDALGDEAAQVIIETLEEPMTANQLSDACDIPLSTMYRKLELLTDASLLAESTEIRRGGGHATLYRRDFEAVTTRVAADGTIAVDIARSADGLDRRLADLWAEVREET